MLALYVLYRRCRYHPSAIIEVHPVSDYYVYVLSDYCLSYLVVFRGIQGCYLGDVDLVPFTYYAVDAILSGDYHISLQGCIGSVVVYPYRLYLAS